MVPLKIRFYPEAAEEAERAAAWYSQHSRIASESFVVEIDRAIEEILQSPHAWPPYRQIYRRRVLSRFPFSVVYRIKENVIEVVAIVHDKKRPGYFENR